MNKPRKTRSVCASPKGKRLLEQAQGELRLSFERIAEKAELADKTVKRFFNGEGIDKKNVYPIIKVLGLQYEDVISLEEEKTTEAIKELEERESDLNSASELIKDLKTILEERRKSTDLHSRSMLWLQQNRQALAQEAAEFALKECDKNLDLGDMEYSQILEELSQDIKKYLRLCYICLEKGTIRVLEVARQKSLMPSNFDSELYEKALIFIKEQKVIHELPQEVSQYLAGCLQYLIAIVPLI